MGLELPSLGQLICRNNLVAVKFNEFVLRDTRNVVAKSVEQRKLKGNMSLTNDNLKRMNNISDMGHKFATKGQEFFDIDPKARQYLSTTFNIQMDDGNCQRSMTNFDRTVASKMFDRSNKLLKDSHNYRMTQSGFFSGHAPSSKEFNMGLRLLREWVRDSGCNSKDGYSAFCRLAGKKSLVLNQSDFWNACQEISVDITEQQSLELFRIMDSNKDGMVTLDDWTSNIHYDHQNAKFKELTAFLRGKKYSMSKVLQLLGFEGIRKVSFFSLKEGLLNLWPGTSEEDALLLSKFIAKGKDEVEVERVIDALNIKDNSPVEVDSEWQTRFLARIKRKMVEVRITEEELLNKFKLCDSNGSGFIEQTDFKTVLGELGVSLNLTELIKVVKFVPINSKNHLKYHYLVERLIDTESAGREELGQAEFRAVMKKVLKDKTPFAVPISVAKLTSWLQSR